MRQLIEKLKADPSIQKVYLNASGGWLFDKKNNHPIVKTREEILALEDSLPVEGVTKDELSNLVEENTLLKEKIEMLELEKSILEDDKTAHAERVKALEDKLAAITPKNKKFNATT